MGSVKIIDTRNSEFRATALRSSQSGEREYFIRDPDGNAIIQCHSDLQLFATLRALSIDSDDIERSTLRMCEDAVGQVMSQRIYGESYYDSGRAYDGYGLIWIPESEIAKIVKILEQAREYGLAALVREGHVKT